ncbi:MAG TPA: DinB family protein [Blastocatellia bacterium]|nr:DinB family protein [Blastocatellia bacterium]
MRTVDQLRDLFDYNEWANRRMIAALKALPEPPVKALRALVHLLIAEKTWLRRLKEDLDSTGYDFWPELGLRECEALADETARSYREFLDGLTEERLDSVATYKNSKGIEYQTSYRDILTHVETHSAYHRGQVATGIRAEGGEPANTDYIVFVRERR